MEKERIDFIEREFLAWQDGAMSAPWPARRMPELIAEVRSLREKNAHLIRVADDLRQVAFDGPREAKGASVRGTVWQDGKVLEKPSEWKERIERETRFVKELADG